MSNYITTETLSALFAAVRFSPNSKTKKEVEFIVNIDLANGATYPDGAAQDIVDYLEINKAFIPSIIDILKETYKQNSAKDFDFYPDNN